MKKYIIPVLLALCSLIAFSAAAQLPDSLGKSNKPLIKNVNTDVTPGDTKEPNEKDNPPGNKKKNQSKDDPRETSDKNKKDTNAPPPQDEQVEDAPPAQTEDAEPVSEIAKTKKQLIAEGFEVCADHPSFGKIYCLESKDLYVYIDEDGIAIPVKKSVLFPETEPTKEPAEEKPILSAKEKLIEEGYIVCAEHPKYGAIYCLESKNQYRYLDQDGIAVPIKKEVVFPEKESTDVKPDPKEADDSKKTGDPPPLKWVPGDLMKRTPVRPNPNLLASWPLIENANDQAGKQQPVSLNKTSIRDNAVWCPGRSAEGDPYNNAVMTPELKGLNLAHFTISVDFNASKIQFQPIIVAGKGCRWLGAEMDSQGNLKMIMNNKDRVPTSVKIQAGKWYNLQIKYADGTAQLLLDQQVLCSKTAPLNIGNCGLNDTRIGSANYSNASAFEGYIRKLQVYSY